MEAQGYQVKDNVLFQDNKSAILLEKNGKALSNKHMKHVNIQYFFITDCIYKGDILLVWCLFRDMIGDFMTKCLQGTLFWEFRDQIMGVVVPTQDQGPGKAKMKIDESNTHTVKPTKGKKLKSSRGESKINSLVPSKVKDSTTGVCWEKLHAQRRDIRRISHLRVEMSPKCNKQVTSKQQTRFSLTSIN